MRVQPNYQLTNEKLAKKFNSLFDLVAHAIRRGRFLVKTGQESKIRSSIKNPAFLTLREIEEGKDIGVLLVDSLEDEAENRG